MNAEAASVSPAHPARSPANGPADEADAMPNGSCDCARATLAADRCLARSLARFSARRFKECANFDKETRSSRRRAFADAREEAANCLIGRIERLLTARRERKRRLPV